MKAAGWFVKACELRSSEMKRSGWIALMLLAGASQGGFAAEDHLNEQQKLGRRLFEQWCGVCNTRPTLVSGRYGRELSKEISGGREAVRLVIITNGPPRL